MLVGGAEALRSVPNPSSVHAKSRESKGHGLVTLNPEHAGMQRRPVVSVVHLHARGGALAAARLHAVVALQGRPWDVHSVPLMTVVDPSGRGVPVDPDGREVDAGEVLVQAIIGLGWSHMVRALHQHWLATEPDVVLSLLPGFHALLHRSVCASLPGVPFATVLSAPTDLPQGWHGPGALPHLICTSDPAMWHARGEGHPLPHLHVLSGPIDSTAPVEHDRALRELPEVLASLMMAAVCQPGRIALRQPALL